MLQYFLHHKAVDGLPNNDHKNFNSHAFPLFKTGHIHDVVYKRYSESTFIKSNCYAEMKKKELYSIRGVFNNSSEITCMVCSCAAGIGTCKHVGALLEELYCQAINS